MSEIKLVSYSELSCRLSDYMATDVVVMKTAISLDYMVDDILRLVNECSYPLNQELEVQNKNLAD